MNTESAHRDPFVLVVLGASNTGKTTAVCQYVFRMRNGARLLPTIEDSYRRHLDDNSVLEIIDTAGTENIIKTMRPLYQRAADAFVLFYSIGSIDTWLRMRAEWAQIAAMHKPIAVVGTRCGSATRRKVDSKMLAEFGVANNVFTCEVDLECVENAVSMFDQFVADARQSKARMLAAAKEEQRMATTMCFLLVRCRPCRKRS